MTSRLLALAAVVALAACTPPHPDHALRVAPPFVPKGQLVPLVTVDGGCYPANDNTGGRWLVTYRYPGFYRFSGPYFSRPTDWKFMGQDEAHRAQAFAEAAVLPWWVEYEVSPGHLPVYEVSEPQGNVFLHVRCDLHPQAAL